ncbi:MAG: hypothetical protein OXR62_06265 [Ahrensia sp.]|nr:hypothetical protein [Ahrensia sp.]
MNAIKLGLALTVFATGVAVGGSSEAAGRVCGDRTKMTEFLKKRYKEVPSAMGVASSGKTVMEVFTSKKGSWTVLMTTAQGVACIMGTGHSWAETKQDELAFLPKS